MTAFLCIGDYIALYCEDTEGYVLSQSSCSAFNGLSIYFKQERDRPTDIPDPQVLTFQICIQNRYKLNKMYRKHYSNVNNSDLDHDGRCHMQLARAAAEAENIDNLAEQKRNQGKRVRYGDIIQLKHVFTNKFIHVNSNQTSQKDKNNMLLSLQNYNAKNAQFRIIPRYKVKSEGEYVQVLDQMSLESIKSPGHFCHASLPFQMDNYFYGSELNLGVDQSGFTIVRCYSALSEVETVVRGGQFVQLFHKELEAYVVAEGLFNDCVTEDVHLRIREVDQLDAKTLSPSSSAITYWQIESEKSPLDGEPLQWSQQFRFRHATIRMYLVIDEENKVTLTRDARDPRTVFKLHPVLQELEELTFESYARIEHVISGSWVHALKDQEYLRKEFEDTEDERSMKALRWDGGSLRQLTSCSDRRYDDAFTIQKVEQEKISNFNIVAGFVPFLQNFLLDRFKAKNLQAKETHRICQALKELRDFMWNDNKTETIKARQKLLRNLRVVDLLVKMVQFPLHDTVDETNLTKVFREVYDTIYTYMIGSSRKNALYFAKYIDFFQTRMMDASELDLKVTQMIVELIRDNRKIVDRISNSQIDFIVDRLRYYQNYRYLELLEVLCVCGNVAIADNQTYIAQKWLLEDQRGIYLTERGQNIHLKPNHVYISVNQMESWISLKDFVDENSSEFNRDEYLFFRKQLDLFNSMCHGRNEYCVRLITKELSYLSWEEAFLCLQSTTLPDEIRAKYCELIIGIFVNVGNNYSVVDYPTLCFVYQYVGTKDFDNSSAADQYAAKDLVTIFPVLRDWIQDFLNNNKGMIASQIAHNMLIEQVLRLLHYLVQFGYYGDVEEVKLLLSPLTILLDGSLDVPFEPDKGKDFSKEKKKMVQLYKTTERYEQNAGTAALVKAKYAALMVLDLVMTFQSNARLGEFICKFKECATSRELVRKSQRHTLCALLDDKFDPYSTKSADLRKQRAMLRYLKTMFDATSPSNMDQLTTILIDLAKYKYDSMNQMALKLLCKLYSIKSSMFKMAINALVLITTDSCRVHREVSKQIPLIRMMAKSKWTKDQVERMEIMLLELKSFCHLPKTPDEPHTMNQKLLISHNALGVIFEILEAETDVQLADSYAEIEKVLRRAVQLMRAVTLRYTDVQNLVFRNLDNLLRVRLVESDLALALKEAFVQNQEVCLKISPKQIQRIVVLAAENQERAPELLDLLTAIVKVEGMNLALKRNQTLVMKYIMQCYGKVAYILEQPAAMREQVLLGEKGPEHMQYLISLVDLIATCAEGDNRYIESLCQTILSVEEIMDILNHESIENHLKKPFLRYMLFSYLKSSTSALENVAVDLLRDRCWESLWKFIKNIAEELNALTAYIQEVEHETIYYMVSKPFPKNIRQHTNCPICTVMVSNDDRPLMLNLQNAVVKVKEDEYRAHASLHYIFDAVFPFIQIFASYFFTPDVEEFATEMDIIDELTTAVVDLCTNLAPILVNPEQLRLIINCLTQLVPKSRHNMSIMESVVNNVGVGTILNDTVSEIKAGNKEYYSSEIQINQQLKTFALNCSLLNGGHNTVTEQLKTTSKREYTTIGGDEDLPLGQEFQDLVQCFIAQNQRKIHHRYQPTELLIRQLDVSARNMKLINVDQFGISRKDQEHLDICALQVLRALVHNEERKLPEDWQFRTSERRIKKGLHNIKDIQCTLNSFQLCTKILPHLASNNDLIVKEVLSLQAIMLFNANTTVQAHLMKYFLETREEVFFYAVRARLHLSTGNIKERRLLQTQQRERRKEAQVQAENLRTTMTLGVKAMKQIQMYEMMSRVETQTQLLTKRQSLSKLQKQKNSSNNQTKKGKKEVNITTNKENVMLLQNEDEDMAVTSISANPLKKKNGGKKKDVNFENEKNTQHHFLAESDDVSETFDQEDEAEEVSMKDDGYIELVLKLLARVCDGQHYELQNYLREQPDNIKSFNLVAEVSQFINVVYSNVNVDTIGLVTQLFSTINEFCAGNQDNRSSVYDNKVIDFINFILRAGDFKGCKIEDVIELRRSIANLIITLIEENNPEAIIIGREVKDTLDKEALYRVIEESFLMLSNDGNENCFKKLFKFSSDKEFKEAVYEVGFSFFIIMERLYDIDPSMGKQAIPITDIQNKAVKFFKKNCMTIEIVKGDSLQKVYFKVKNKNLIREEVKEKLKWSVDRTSPSNKIRDFMEWAEAILEDVTYQRRVLSNPIAAFLTKFWLLWNHGATVLSLILNILMLIGLKSPYREPTTNATYDNHSLTAEFAQSWITEYESFEMWMKILGLAHNVISFILVLTYFLANHPGFPDVRPIISKINRMIRPKNLDDENEADEDHVKSKLGVSMFSFLTVYYLIFLACSLAGRWYLNYFFAFHLVNIVNNNQLLQGVIQAVTQNGLSLIWVSILGIVIMYLYTIIGFTLLHTAFNEKKYLYSDTLMHCFVSVIRFGLIGDLFENLEPDEKNPTFWKFGQVTIFNVTFFILITTIGLNIIFGIIVDTFSELRDLKWTAESDMRDTCFICSRNSYDFEHHGEGFDYHVLYEHNMWAYLYFFISLKDTKATDYTSLQLYVAKMLAEKKTDYFPLNRALCLSAKDEDSTESKIDDLLNNVRLLVLHQKEEDTEKKRWEELLRQKRWQKRHRAEGSIDGRTFEGSPNGSKRNIHNELIHSSHSRHSQLFMGDKSMDPIEDSISKGSCESQDSDYALGTSRSEMDIIDQNPPPPSEVQELLQFLDDYAEDSDLQEKSTGEEEFKS